MVYVRVGGNPKVYSAPTSLKTSFDKGLNDLRDKRLLTFDQGQLTRVDLLSGKTTIEFGKNPQSEWAIVQPQPYRADNFQVEELLRKLSDSKMDLKATPADTEKAQKGFASGKPVASVKLTDSTGTQTLEVRKNGDDYFGKSSVVDGAYKLTADLGKQLEKPLDDFRNKKIFDFGFSDPTRIEIQGKIFTKSGSDWKMDGKTMDSSAVQALIDQLRELTATAFATEGFTTTNAWTAFPWFLMTENAPRKPIFPRPPMATLAAAALNQDSTNWTPRRLTISWKQAIKSSRRPAARSSQASEPS